MYLIMLHFYRSLNLLGRGRVRSFLHHDATIFAGFDASMHLEGIRHVVRVTAATRRTMKKNSREFDPRKFLQAAMRPAKYLTPAPQSYRIL
jgi:hypothetical protein